MKFGSRDLALTAVFAALYATINTTQTMLGGPITYGPIQLRIADCLIALAALFSWPLVFGVTLGCIVGNLYYLPSLYGAFGALVFVDSVFGPAANFAAGSLVRIFGKRRLLACVLGALTIGIIVGGYLWLLFLPPDILGFPVWLASMISITVSSLIAIAGIGYILLTVLSRQNIIKALEAHGLGV